MKIKDKISIGTRIIKSKISGNKMPILIGWSLTNRCNIKCKYCNIPNIKEKELNLEQIYRIIDQLADAGCKRINFTGGEPFLRSDLYDIVKYCKMKGIFTGVTSNGTLVNKNSRVLKYLDLLMLSLDGHREINDRFRGKGSYDAVVNLIKNLPSDKLALSTVIYKQNIKYIRNVLEIAKSFNVKVHLQPVSDIFLSKGPDNDGLNSTEIDAFIPEESDYKNLLTHLIENKLQYPIMNSVSGLKYMHDYPNVKKLDCPAGKIFFRISCSGKLYSCYRQLNDASVSLLEHSLDAALLMLPKPKCEVCSIADGMEISNIYNLDVGSIINAFKNM